MEKIYATYNFQESKIEYRNLRQEYGTHHQHFWFHEQFVPIENRIGDKSKIIGYRFDEYMLHWWEIYTQLWYESPSNVHFISKVESGDVVVDIGANIGMYSYQAIENGASKVISFEPYPQLYQCLSYNKEINQDVYNWCIGSENNIVEMITTVGGCPTMKNYFDTWQEKGERYDYRPVHGKYYAPCYTLDYLFDNGVLDTVDFMKIDAEGAEVDILKGCSDENLGKIKKMALEVHRTVDSDMIELQNTMVDRLGTHYTHCFADTRGDGQGGVEEIQFVYG